MTELKAYLDYLCKSTNMKCLTPEKALTGVGDYMAANLYARSIFGEDALANLSIEKPLDNSEAAVTGHIRIRAKSQVRSLFINSFYLLCVYLLAYLIMNTFQYNFLSVHMYILFVFLFLFQGMAISLGDKINKVQKATIKSVGA